MKAWHFVRDDRHERFSKSPQFIKAGYTYYVEPPLELCKWGLHASILPLDALTYAPGAVVCRVELGGQTIKDNDKICVTKRTVLWMADATKTLHLFAIWCAERALARVENPDPRSLKALGVKRAWLTGEATDGELAQAADTAATAAWDMKTMNTLWEAARAVEVVINATQVQQVAMRAAALARTTAETVLNAESDAKLQIAAREVERTEQNEQLTKILNQLKLK